MVPAEGGPKMFKLQSSWRQRGRSKILAVRKGRRGGNPPPPTVYDRSNTSLPPRKPSPPPPPGRTIIRIHVTETVKTSRPRRNRALHTAEPALTPGRPNAPAPLQLMHRPRRQREGAPLHRAPRARDGEPGHGHRPRQHAQPEAHAALQHRLHGAGAEGGVPRERGPPPGPPRHQDGGQGQGGGRGVPLLPREGEGEGPAHELGAGVVVAPREPVGPAARRDGALHPRARVQHVPVPQVVVAGPVVVNDLREGVGEGVDGEGRGGGLGGDALEGEGPQRRLDRRLEGVAEAVGGGYCRLLLPVKLALAVTGTVAGQRLGALEGGGGGVLPPFHCSPGERDGLRARVEGSDALDGAGRLHGGLPRRLLAVAKAVGGQRLTVTKRMARRRGWTEAVQAD